MSRYRLEPTREQETVLLRHCSDARYVWNLAVEQHAWWRPGRRSAPGYLEQCRQLTAARAGNPWLAGGSQTVQQQALRDFARATARNIAAGHAVKARGGDGASRPVNREPQLLAPQRG
jgi:putative transposase